MAKLVDMKITKSERKARQEKYKTAMPMMDGDGYPYDLKLRLNTESLEKLDIKSLPKVGRKIRVVCECTVTSTSQDARSRSGEQSTNRSVELQIQKLSLDLAPSSAEEAVADGIDEAGDD